jgi:predicted dehydrogenase
MAHTRKFKVAVVGVSTEAAEEFLLEISSSRTIKLVAACDEDCESLKKTCEAYVINGYHTYEDLIENEEIDFAIITVQNGTRTSEISKNKIVYKK